LDRREYYERNNSLIQQYIYIDRLLDSSLPHSLLNEYEHAGNGGNALEVPPTIPEGRETPTPKSIGSPSLESLGNSAALKKVKRTPRELYKVSNETTPLFQEEDDDDDVDGPKPEIPGIEDDSVESGDRIVQVAIYVNLVANTILLAGKIAVIVLTSSL
jgi:hypothetical protein